MGNPVNQETAPEISVIIPVFNSRATIAACLAGVYASRGSAFEVFVVDNGSTDGTLDALKGFPCEVLKLNDNFGAAFARNRGAEQARGSLLVFIDSDIVIKEGTLAALKRDLAVAGTAAAGGIYAPFPCGGGFVTLYKNYYCHYSALESAGEALFFSTSCGAVRAEVFKAFGGFDEKFSFAGGEDIELGYRLAAKGLKILRDRDIQVTHLKEFSFAALLSNDYRRAEVWIKILLKEKFLRGQKFFKDEGSVSNKAAWSVTLAAAAVFFALLTPNGVFFPAAALLSLAGFYLANKGLFGFIRAREGAAFAAGAVVVHFGAQLAAAMGCFIGLAEHLLSKNNG